MKKFVTLLMTSLLMVMCTVNVFAATYVDTGVLDVGYATGRNSRETFNISVATSGKATDGVTEITFNAEEMTVKEDKILISEDVDLYSVNITEGSIKISYLSENPIAKGHLIFLQLDVKEAYYDKTVSATVTCIANDANGNALKTGYNVEIPNSTEEPETATEAVTEASTEKATEKATEAVTEAPTEVATEVTTEAATEVVTEVTTEAATEVTTEAPAKTPVEVKLDPVNEEAWTEVIEKLETVTAEEELVVVFEKEVEAVVAVEFLEAVKEQETTVVLALDNGISWVIDGSTITDAVEVNFNVTVDAGEIPEEKIQEVAAEKETVKISLAHDGDFGCEPEMKFPAGEEKQGKQANLYYYNPETGELEFICSAIVGEDGYVSLKFTHASDYVVVYEEAPVDDTVVVQPEAPASNTGMVIGVVALLAVVIVAVVAVMKKKAN